MTTSNNLPNWFCIGPAVLSNGLAASFNGLTLPVDSRCFMAFPDNPAGYVVPSAHEWFTLPNGLNLLTDVEYPVDPDSEEPFCVSMVDREGNISPTDFITPSWVSLEDIPGDAGVEGARAAFDASLAQYEVNFQEYEALGGFVEIDQSFSGASYRLSYSPQVKAVQDGPWAWMGTSMGPFDDLALWQSVLECIVSFTGNYGLLDTVDLHQVQQEYVELLEEGF